MWRCWGIWWLLPVEAETEYDDLKPLLKYKMQLSFTSYKIPRYNIIEDYMTSYQTPQHNNQCRPGFQFPAPCICNSHRPQTSHLIFQTPSSRHPPLSRPFLSVSHRWSPCCPAVCNILLDRVYSRTSRNCCKTKGRWASVQIVETPRSSAAPLNGGSLENKCLLSL